MSAEVQVAAFEGGQLRVLSPGNKCREAVLALPLNRMLMKMVRVPADADPVEFATPLVQALSPFPDEPLTVSCETVRENEHGRVVIAAAFPEGAADDIGEALDAAKLNVVKIDALILGQMRGIWSMLGGGDQRRLVLVQRADSIEMVVLDGDQPASIRAVADAADLRREVMLLLLEAETFAGARKLAEIVVVAADSDSSPSSRLSNVETLAAFAPVREVTVGADAALSGVAERVADDESLNVLPDSWREVLEETRFKSKMIKWLAVAGGIWLVVMGVLFGVPMGYDWLTERQREMSKQHARQYKAVKDMVDKVGIISKHSDHARGALEIMKVVSDRLPDGITLTSWNYKRDEGIMIRGESESDEAVLLLKDEMDDVLIGDENDKVPLFGVVELKGPDASKSKKGWTFDLACRFEGKDE